MLMENRPPPPIVIPDALHLLNKHRFWKHRRPLPWSLKFWGQEISDQVLPMCKNGDSALPGYADSSLEFLLIPYTW